ncbi:MAG: hypothetical protein N5P05_001018 [Chroococcopsis gigantea SAG 12.99]|jgi:hypothetical protein|nr:hypothetical protein [Chroococcopsis gigantea SAG 12.99]
MVQDLSEHQLELLNPEFILDKGLLYQPGNFFEEDITKGIIFT